MSEQLDAGKDHARWEKPDFEVTPLAELEKRPGFDPEADRPPS